MRPPFAVCCCTIASVVASCSTQQASSEQKAHLRAGPVLRIEQQIAEMIRTSGDWEMAEFRSYKQTDLDGDGIDDAILLTTFEHGMVWRRELFVCLSSSSNLVRHLNVGSKGERSAENFTVAGGTIIVRGKTYTDAGAMCCPSKPYESTILIANGQLKEKL